tara:strand:- start:12325 stop:12861 length:537 start_codon:yes stop_codon:yes gene_type:complete
MWKTVDRPGQSGFKKDALVTKWNGLYGKGNWRKAWTFEEKIIDKLRVFKICEDAYYADSIAREKIWTKLLTEAKEIYDMLPEEVDSGLDYKKQHKFTRFHDICIRNVLIRRGWKFKGEKIQKIRWNKENPNWFSENFDPGKVKFHLPKLICKPNLTGWWNKNSVEDFYQSNKVLQAKE